GLRCVAVWLSAAFASWRYWRRHPACSRLEATSKRSDSRQCRNDACIQRRCSVSPVSSSLGPHTSSCESEECASWRLSREAFMIRAIAAVDDRLGISTDAGIPWNVPADVAHFRALTLSSNVLMGYGTYTEFANPMEGRTNYVATRRTEKLRDGFLPVSDLRTFFT